MNRSIQELGEMQFRFKPRGIGRFFVAAFLGLWLCGWVLGECFAVVTLAWAGYEVLTGMSFFGAPVSSLGAALTVCCFVSMWLGLWTVGGILAQRELFKCLWAEDRLVLSGASLVIHSRIGPFRSERRFAVTDVCRIFVRRSGRAIMELIAQVGPETVELSCLGTPSEREDTALKLSTSIGLVDDFVLNWPAALPGKWDEVKGAQGEPLLVCDFRSRLKGAKFVRNVAAMAWLLVGFIIWSSFTRPDFGSQPALSAVVIGASGLTWFAFWLHSNRKEWRIEPGRLVFQSRGRNTVKELARATELELSMATDSDGDCWYQLDALCEATSNVAGAGVSKPKRIKLERALHDPTAPRCLGRWLAARTSVPLYDFPQRTRR